MNTRHSCIIINETALAHNFECIQKLTPRAKILAMVKANAYGHGLVNVAKILSQAQGFGVACLEEAVLLREAGIKQKIVLMRGIYTPVELEIANQLALDVVIHENLQLSLLSKQTHWLKINTGMNRLGFSPEKFPVIYNQIKNKEIILMTHFSQAENILLDKTSQQITCFCNLTTHLSQPKSLANSAAILNFKESHADWVRPGLLLYGVSPIENTIGKDFNVIPVMTWQSQLIAVRMQKKGDKVGYGGTYTCEENMPIGIVGVGHADGYPRHAQNGTPVLVNDREVPLIGRVSMDMLAVDLRKIPSSKTGDPVILWGEQLPIEKVAAHTATNAYELLCNVRLRGSIEK